MRCTIGHAVRTYHPGASYRRIGMPAAAAVADKTVASRALGYDAATLVRSLCIPLTSRAHLQQVNSFLRE